MKTYDFDTISAEFGTRNVTKYLVISRNILPPFEIPPFMGSPPYTAADFPWAGGNCQLTSVEAVRSAENALSAHLAKIRKPKRSKAARTRHVAMHEGTRSHVQLVNVAVTKVDMMRVRGDVVVPLPHPPVSVFE